MDFCNYSLRFYLDWRHQVIRLDQWSNTDLSSSSDSPGLERKTLPEYVSDAFKIATDLLTGIKYLHESHVMHRDIKPENLLWNESKNSWQICDFGLAREVAPTGISYDNSNMVVALRNAFSTGIGKRFTIKRVCYIFPRENLFRQFSIQIEFSRICYCIY